MSNEKGSIAAGIGVIFLWLVIIGANVALLGTIIWGLIKLVGWLTSQTI